MINKIKETILDSDISILFVDNSDCSVCSVVYPEIEAISSNYGVKLLNVNSANHPEVMSLWSVFVYPCIIIFTEGKEAKRFERVFSIKEIESSISRYVEIIRE